MPRAQDLSNDFTVRQLKQQLRDLRAPVHGRKADLAARLADLLNTSNVDQMQRGENAEGPLAGEEAFSSTRSGELSPPQRRRILTGSEIQRLLTSGAKEDLAALQKAFDQDFRYFQSHVADRFAGTYRNWPESLAHEGAATYGNWLVFAIKQRLKGTVLEILGAPSWEESSDSAEGAAAETTQPTHSAMASRWRNSDWVQKDSASRDWEVAVLFDTEEEDSEGHSAFAHAVRWGDMSVLVGLILYDRKQWWQPSWTALLEAKIRASTTSSLDDLHNVFQVRFHFGPRLCFAGCTALPATNCIPCYLSRRRIYMRFRSILTEDKFEEFALSVKGSIPQMRSTEAF